MIGRRYLERGHPVTVLVRWGPGGGPRNVLIAATTAPKWSARSAGCANRNRRRETTVGFKFRKQLRLGPVRLHFTQRGFSSWSLKIGRWTWNSRTRRQTIDTPGPGYWHS